MTRTAAEVRQQFIDFFCRRHGHAVVPSSPVVPHDDPTLLFANAGMNQFKPYFLGLAAPKHPRVANTQKCIRAGGKHNDLDDVGHDTYHHTFFEMLGNWSFGDYFKKEAIDWAWELLVSVWGLDPARLHATYFGGDAAEGLEPDIEARDLWLAVLKRHGLGGDHVHAGGKKDNFWEMGDTGPCGPCSEIHVDLTPDKTGGGLINAGDARAIEIWNLVFIQFNRDAGGKLTPLPSKHVDTGMGFERVTAVLQGHNNNYATDVFVPIIREIERISGHEYGRGQGAEGPRGKGAEGMRGGGDEGMSGGDAARLHVPTSPHPHVPTPSYATFLPGDMRDEACRVIADHVRCLTFAVTDGAVPDKDGRGYVLRRILRRAVRYGWQYLDLHKPFLCRLVDTVVEAMGDAFPELKKNPQHVKDIIREEEESFERTLERGIALFEEAADAGRRRHGNVLQGEDAFKLHDTYGFPIDLTEVMAHEKGLTVDIGEYERLMEEARERARAGGKDFEAAGAVIPPELLASLPATDDLPKYAVEPLRARLIGFVRNDPGQPPALGGAKERLEPGQRAGLVFDRTCFYAEAGGQVGDRGQIREAGGRDAGTGGREAHATRFDVDTTQRIGEVVVHLGTLVQGSLAVGDEVELVVDEHRPVTMKNHTATHLLNWALREVLGEHVQQKGSLVDPEKTRFDFSHPKAMTPEEIERVERLVNERIAAKLPVDYQVVPQADALKINGLRAVFGERYPDMVRVMSIGVPVAELLKNPGNREWRKYSVEFCGGTHLHNTGEIERFVIESEEAVAKGVRRIVAITGPTAQLIEECGAALVRHAQELKAAPSGEASAGLAELQHTLVSAAIAHRHRVALRGLLDELQKAAKKQQKATTADAAEQMRQILADRVAAAPKVGSSTVMVAELAEVTVDQLKTGADMVKQKCGSAAILFGTTDGGKVVLLAAMTDDLVKRGLKAGDLVKAVAPLVGGGGGGPPTMAQAGGKQPEKLGEALAAGEEWIWSRLGSKAV